MIDAHVGGSHNVEDPPFSGGDVVSLAPAAHPLRQRKNLLTISVRGSVNPRAIVRLKVLGKLKTIQ
jgi:hypothetical protein